MTAVIRDPVVSCALVAATTGGERFGIRDAIDLRFVQGAGHAPTI